MYQSTHGYVFAMPLKDHQIANGTSIIDIMLGQGNLEFEHKIRHGDVKGVSKITLKPGKDDKCFICIMLRFCYGIRNVMAHGNADRTFGKGNGSALKDFPTCKTCACTDSCPTCIHFKKITVFLEKYNEYISGLPDNERTRVEKVVRHTHPRDECFDEFKRNPNDFFQDTKEW